MNVSIDPVGWNPSLYEITTYLIVGSVYFPPRFDPPVARIKHDKLGSILTISVSFRFSRFISGTVRMPEYAPRSISRFFGIGLQSHVSEPIFRQFSDRF